MATSVRGTWPWTTWLWLSVVVWCMEDGRLLTAQSESEGQGVPLLRPEMGAGPTTVYYSRGANHGASAAGNFDFQRGPAGCESATQSGEPGQQDPEGAAGEGSQVHRVRKADDDNLHGGAEATLGATGAARGGPHRGTAAALACEGVSCQRHAWSCRHYLHRSAGQPQRGVGCHIAEIRGATGSANDGPRHGGVAADLQKWEVADPSGAGRRGTSGRDWCCPRAGDAAQPCPAWSRVSDSGWGHSADDAAATGFPGPHVRRSVASVYSGKGSSLSSCIALQPEAPRSGLQGARGSSAFGCRWRSETLENSPQRRDQGFHQACALQGDGPSMLTTTEAGDAQGSRVARYRLAAFQAFYRPGGWTEQLRTGEGSWYSWPTAAPRRRPGPASGSSVARIRRHGVNKVMGCRRGSGWSPGYTRLRGRLWGFGALEGIRPGCGFFLLGPPPPPGQCREFESFRVAPFGSSRSHHVVWFPSLLTVCRAQPFLAVCFHWVCVRCLPVVASISGQIHSLSGDLLCEPFRFSLTHDCRLGSPRPCLSSCLGCIPVAMPDVPASFQPEGCQFRDVPVHHMCLFSSASISSGTGVDFVDFMPPSRFGWPLRHRCWQPPWVLESFPVEDASSSSRGLAALLFVALRCSPSPLSPCESLAERAIGTSVAQGCQPAKVLRDGDASFPQWLHRLPTRATLFTCEHVAFSPPFFPLGSCGLVPDPLRSWAVHGMRHVFRIVDVPKRQIGGSGLSTSSGPFLFLRVVGASVNAFVDIGVHIVIPIFRALALIFWLMLLKAIWQVLPGRSSPMGRCLGFPLLGISTVSLACVGACGRPERVAMDWQPWRDRKRRTARRAAVKCFPAMPGLCRLAFLLGACRLPVCVWAAPPGLPSALSLTEAAMQLLPDTLPPLPPDPPGPASLGSRMSQLAGAGSDTVEGGTTPVDRHVRLFAPGAKTCDVCIINVASTDPEAVLQVVRSCLPRTFVTPYARLLPTQPQVGTGLVSAVAVPGWISQSFRKVVVFDFSCCDGPVYAAITWDQLTLKDLAEEAAGQGLKQWAVYVALSLIPVQATFRVNNGDFGSFH